MGRRKGSKNKTKIIETSLDNQKILKDEQREQAEPIKRGRGRPKGAKAKPKEIKETSLEIKRIKKEIKDLRAEKLRLPSGSEQRIELHRKIKEMKSLLTEKKEVKTQAEQRYNDPEKEKLIAEILKLEPDYPKDICNLNKFTNEQLQKHIDIIKRRQGVK